MSRVDKSKMPCNKPRASTKANKKKMVKACEGGKERLIHFGEKGYGHNYSAAARKSWRFASFFDLPPDKPCSSLILLAIALTSTGDIIVI